MDGILLVDKPRGPSSFKVVAQVKRAWGIKKIGHAGTLDPLASGLLVLCLGRFTKLAAVLTNDDKVYEAVFRLGTTTSTDDEEGDILYERSYEHLTKENVLEALEKFVGAIEQTPPQFSAIKINGVRAYQQARRQQTVVLKKRPVHVSSIKLLHYCEGLITVRVSCQKGFYIRALARDVGEALGVGAHAKEIRRIQSGQFDIENARKLDEVSQEKRCDGVFSKSSALGLETIQISDEDRKNIVHGRKIKPFNLKNDIGIAAYGDDVVALLKKENNSARIMRVI